MSDDTPEELKKYRPELIVKSGEPVEIAPPYLVEAVPVCRVETWSNGTRYYKEEHEPDEEFERLVYGGPDGFAKFYKRGTGERVGKIRFCKHCGCLYLEKNTAELVTMKEATGYTLSEMKEKEDGHHDT